VPAYNCSSGWLPLSRTSLETGNIRPKFAAKFEIEHPIVVPAYESWIVNQVAPTSSPSILLRRTEEKVIIFYKNPCPIRWTSAWSHQSCQLALHHEKTKKGASAADLRTDSRGKGGIEEGRSRRRGKSKSVS